MTDPIARAAAAAPAASPSPGEDARLRKVAGQMQGVFVQELFKAMRATVPQGEGVVGGGAGEEMFTGLMDQHLAVETPSQWQHGLDDAIYRQLRGRLAAASGGSSPALPGGAPLVGSLADHAAAMPLSPAGPTPTSPLHPPITSLRDADR